MIDYKVKLEGLDIFLEDLSTKRISKQLAMGVAHATSQINKVINDAVVDTYNIKRAEVEKASPKVSSIAKRGRNVIKQGIIYKYKAKSLHTFDYRESTISVKSRFLLPRGNGSFAMIKRRQAKSVSVEVRRGKRKTVVGKYGFGGFYQKRASSSKWAAIQGGRSTSRPQGIYERKQDATWITEPIDRAPISRLYGPSVVQMVNTVIDFDSKVKDRIDNFDELIAEHLQL